MNLGENIHNAFEVVDKTYLNVRKLMDYCKLISEQKGDYSLAVPKFLRNKSDDDYRHWYIRSLIQLYQDAHDPLLENGWRDGDVYVLDINLYDPEENEQPVVTIARFSYKKISDWTENCSPANHHIFYEPLYKWEYRKMEGSEIMKAVIKEEQADRYWGIRSILRMDIPLVYIDVNNVYTMIFEGFTKLKNA